MVCAIRRLALTAYLMSDTHRRRDLTVESSRVGGGRNSQQVGDSLDESEQICQQ